VESYKVSIKPSAAKELEALPGLKDRQRATSLIRGLAANPRPQGSLKLAGATDAYRIRFGSYRILYTVSDRVRIVAVIKIAHRREAYR
jgi:mRNA interferase RelE/StbE